MPSVVFNQNPEAWSIAAWKGDALPKTEASFATPDTPPALPQAAGHLANHLLETMDPDAQATIPTLVDKVELHAKLMKNLAEQAGYKYRGQGIVHQSWGQRLLNTVKTGATERYQCATLRAQQHAIIPAIKHLYKTQQTENLQSPLQRWQAILNGIQCSAVTQAFLSLDNAPSLLKLDPELLNTLGRRERLVLKLNRWAFGINGLNEIVVSLTGMCFNAFKTCFFPQGHEHSGRIGLKILATLATITLATAALSKAFFGKLTNPWLASVVHEFTACAVRLVCSISAVGFLLGFLSSCLCMAASAVRSQIKSALPQALQKQVEDNWEVNIKRLGALVFEATQQAEIHFFLCQALQKKLANNKTCLSIKSTPYTIQP